MKTRWDFLITCTTMVATCFITGKAYAEIPNRSEQQLLASASHSLAGTIERTYETKEMQGEYEYNYGVAEVAVTRVDKGADITINDRVFVRYWRKKWKGNGFPPPGHFGHRDIPSKTDVVEVYVKGDRKSGFDVLSPNGFFKATKPKTPENNPSR